LPKVLVPEYSEAAADGIGRRLTPFQDTTG